MSSTYTLYPSSVADNTAARRDKVSEPRSLPQHQADGQQYPQQPSTPHIAGHLSAFSPQFRSNSGSPQLSNTHTPAESTLSVHYQSSEYSEAEDPFFGVSFENALSGSPSFLPPEDFPLQNDELANNLASQTAFDGTSHVPQPVPYMPMSPDKTPSLHTRSPEQKGDQPIFSQLSGNLIAAHGLANLANQSSVSLTPQTSGSGRSSDDGLAPAAVVMPAQSPRVTVSMWGKDDVQGQYTLDTDQNLSTFADISADGSAPESPRHTTSTAARDETGSWVLNRATGQGGIDPDNRPADEVPSVNQLDAQRKVEERNQEVGEWLARSRSSSVNHQSNPGVPPHEEPPAAQSNEDDDNIPQREIPLGDETENNPVPGQTYFMESGGLLTEEDVEIMRQNRNWAAEPMLFSIFKKGTRYQPESSQAAIAKFEKMCRDTDSIVSRAATWGTRRRSLPSIAPSIADVEGVISGNFLKKLSLSRGDTRRPSIMQEIRGRLNRRPSASFTKRARDDDAGSGKTDSSPEQSQVKLAPPSPSPGGWNKNKGVPSINTAFVAMGSNIAAIGATHARSGSVSATPPITSPRSPMGSFTASLSVKKPLRIRSKSDLSRNQPSSIADMWKKSGGPPVANLAKPSNVPELDDYDEDEDDLYEDPDMKTEGDKIDIAPNFVGFQQHVLKLNPLLSTTNNYLVDRIAHQQIVRYKSLLSSRVKHLQHTASRNCPTGVMCIALGGSANVLDAKGDPRSLDPMSARFDGSDGDITPLEGTISQESFPPDIPMPPTSSLPAEFECQLCFQAKKFTKPSDWTKHVHEDVQPFTCTWDRCRDPKIFKRKADWVRHENEGHRHLEWWTCDFEECRHVCYRRDNFLQHLVREHKFPEPKVKTKAAIKRAGGIDPTWQKVEQCHMETQALPQGEPCRFCGKSFQTWKKLTVHLAKHMEQISLPILRLVARKELEADTIISPVQDPPPRPFPVMFPTKQEPGTYDPSPTVSQPPLSRPPLSYPHQHPHHQQHHHQQHQQQQHHHQQHQQPQFMYHSISMVGPTPLSIQTVGHGHPVSHGFSNLDSQYSGLPVTTYIGAPNHYSSVAPDLEPFPALVNMNNPLGLSDPTTASSVQHMPYGNHPMMDPRSAGPPSDQYNSQGSVSPYSHSPNQGQGAFYSQ
ncbi:hypothetical protein B0H63DRAFT_386034 [Podospora didyma]|uniref:C2H2-type domain-containing protein n=1 Tax=Podospora didyma TaxID=330526 RepID=A0AAE0P487_9PEZI|nr:hypothetical protein B0H63DRAFT_386034 [Podospora didyma]